MRIMPGPTGAMTIAGLVAGAAMAQPAPALVLFAQPGFQGGRMKLTTEASSVRFSARSAEIEGGPWELCPRPFFGGTCITLEASEPRLNLPRAFSGMVGSARPATADPADEKPDELEKKARPMIRPARAEDLPALAAIEAAAEQLFAGTPMAFVLALPKAPVATAIAEGVLIWVAMDDTGTPVGFLEAEPRSGWLHVLELSVHPDAQRRGHARRLIETALAHARAEGLLRVSLSTDGELAWNGPMYRRLGFEDLPAERQPGWLRTMVDAEIAAGFDPARRVVLARRP